MIQKSALEEMLAIELRHDNVPPFERHYRFCPGRKWEIDFAWPDFMVAVEVEGGQWVEGRHNRPEGFAKDVEKYNMATFMGWRLYRVTGDMVNSGAAGKLVLKVLGIDRSGL